MCEGTQPVTADAVGAVGAVPTIVGAAPVPDVDDDDRDDAGADGVVDPLLVHPPRTPRTAAVVTTAPSRATIMGGSLDDHSSSVR